MRFGSAGFFLIAVLVMLAGCSTTKLAVTEGQGAPRAATGWTTALHDGQRSNVTTEELGVPLKKVWCDDISPFTFLSAFPSTQLSGPVISDGSLYVGSEDGHVYSYDLDSGRLNWKFKAGVPVEGTPTVGEKEVCVGTSDGLLMCLDRTDGTELWSFQATSEVLSAPLITDAKLYFSSSADKLYCLDPATGEKLWSYTHRTFKTVTSRLYVSTAGSDGRLYHTFSDGTLVCLEALSGKELWSKKVVTDFGSPDQIRRTPLLYGGLVYVIGANNSITALDAKTGDEVRTYDVIAAHDFVITGKRSLVIAGTDKVVALDRLSGAILWTKDLEGLGPVYSVLATSGKLIVVASYDHSFLGIKYFTSSRGLVLALDLTTGEKVWERKLTATVTANVSTASERLALFTNEGGLEIYGAR